MRQPFACPARRPVAITSQLSLATQHASYPLLFGRAVVLRILTVTSRWRLSVAVVLGKLLGQIVEVGFLWRLGIRRRHVCDLKIEDWSDCLKCEVLRMR